MGPLAYGRALVARILRGAEVMRDFPGTGGIDEKPARPVDEVTFATLIPDEV